MRIAYIPSRSWERASPVTAFRALQAPFLVIDYPLLHEITTGAIARMMLASLDRIGIVGLGLVPNELRRPLGRRPLDSPAAFRGARIRVATSPTGELALRALCAVPLTNFTSNQVGPALASDRLVGVESSTKSIGDNGYVQQARYLPSNLGLFAKTQTIAIRRSVFDRLSAADQAAFRAAAATTANHANPAAQERSDVKTLCAQGLKLVQATPSAGASLRRAATPAYAALERDPLTRNLIREIERLKAEAPTTVGSLPACPSRRARGGHAADAVGIAGTYVINISRAEMEAMSAGGAPGNQGFSRLVLGKARVRISDRRTPDQVRLVQGSSSGWTSGTYSIRGNRLTFFIETDMAIRRSEASATHHWSLYRNMLTFKQGKKNEGGAGLWLKPWRRVS